MKFCSKKRHVYSGSSGVETSTDYVTLNDVLNFHGKNFTDIWTEFISKKPTLSIDDTKCFYYPDYQFAARQADSILNAKNY